MPKSKNRRKRRRRHKRVQRRGFRVQIGANLLPIVNARKHLRVIKNWMIKTDYFFSRHDCNVDNVFFGRQNVLVMICIVERNILYV